MPHRTHEMRTIVTNNPGVCQSVGLCLFVTRAECTKTAERIDVLFGVETPRYPRNIVSDESSSPTAMREGTCHLKRSEFIGISF